MAYLPTKMRLITKPDILELVGEFELLRPIASENWKDSPLVHFLSQCFLDGNGKKMIINKNELAGCEWLSKKISNLRGSPLYTLCQEIAEKCNESFPFHEGKYLYNFLNTMIPNLGKGKSKRTYWTHEP